MRRITSNEQLESARKNRPDQTQTWLVEESVGAWPDAKSEPNVREMNRDEIREMAAYLESDEDELKGPFYVNRDLKCPHCGRATTFLDFIKTAVDAGLHEKSLMRDILRGHAGRWITIVGKTEERTVVCVNCNRMRRITTRGDCNYSGHWYRYDG